MSHLKLRNEKDCLNCGEIIQGTYCSNCGQENREPRISFFKLATHFISDIIHFDGKFFATLKILFQKPGLLPKQFIEGKRVRYVDPIRMYIFTSAIFFFIFFLLINTDETFNWNNDRNLTKLERDSTVISLQKKLQNKNLKNIDTGIVNKQIALLLDTTKAVNFITLAELNNDFTFFNISEKNYISKKQYDSIQLTLSTSQRDGWIMKRLIYKEIELNKKFRKDRVNASAKFADVFLHQLPILLFVSLPIFAFILKLMYIRRRKYFYVDHSIFSIFHYIFSFIIFLAVILLSQLSDKLNLGFIKYIQLTFIIYWIVYLHKSLRTFYSQSRFKTIIKLILIGLLGFASIVLLFIVFFFFSVFQL